MPPKFNFECDEFVNALAKATVWLRTFHNHCQLEYSDQHFQTARTEKPVQMFLGHVIWVHHRKQDTHSLDEVLQAVVFQNPSGFRVRP